MTTSGGKGPGNVRLGAVIVLTLAAVLLSYLDSRRAPVSAREAEHPSPLAGPEVQAIVDSMLNRYGISRSSVRVWNILSLDRKPIRIAEQIEVPRAFPSLVFNAQLQKMLEPHSARVFATERSRDNVVTMHIVRRGKTIRSLAFSLTRSEEEKPGATPGQRGRQ